MRRRLKGITPEFVEYIPSEGKDLILGIAYISMKHNMVVYRCPCGCGGLSEFMLDPIRFRMEYDGANVSFYPSIGISYLECRSHYWIRDNRIEWCAPMKDWESGLAQRREVARALELRRTEESNRSQSIGKLWKELVGWWKR